MQSADNISILCTWKPKRDLVLNLDNTDFIVLGEDSNIEKFNRREITFSAKKNARFIGDLLDRSLTLAIKPKYCVIHVAPFEKRGLLSICSFKKTCLQISNKEKIHLENKTGLQRVMIMPEIDCSSPNFNQSNFSLTNVASLICLKRRKILWNEIIRAYTYNRVPMKKGTKQTKLFRFI